MVHRVISAISQPVTLSLTADRRGYDLLPGRLLTTHQRYSYFHNIIGNFSSLLSVNGNDNRILLGSVDGNSLSLSPGALGESAVYFLGPQTSSVADPRIRHCQWASMAYLLPGRRLWVPAPNRIRLLLTVKKNSRIFFIRNNAEPAFCHPEYF